MTTAHHPGDMPAQQWKSGNEFAPYHPSASHVDPNYRDGWNACFALAEQRTRAMREALQDARYFVELYQRRNPRFEHDGAMQDPSGVNACLERIDAVLGEKPLLLQDENAGREGRRYNEWHASRPDARLNAREAAATLLGRAPPSAPGNGEADAKGATRANNCGDFAKLTEEVARDAMRYRWLRECSPVSSTHYAVSINWPVMRNGKVIYGERLIFGQELDEHIDAAMLPSAPAQSGGQGNG